MQQQPISIFIGMDPRERAATNVLIDSLVDTSSAPLAITPLVTPSWSSKSSIGASAIPNKAPRSPSLAFWCPS